MGQKLQPKLVVKNNNSWNKELALSGIPAFQQRNSYMKGELSIEWFDHIQLEICEDTNEHRLK
jgi:hypothetical protein